jgi:hypothetical protein
MRTRWWLIVLSVGGCLITGMVVVISLDRGCVILPGVKKSIITARSIAARLATRTATTGRCPSREEVSSSVELDAWERPFHVSCEEGSPPKLVVKSEGRDGILGTIDDIIVEGDAAQPGIAAVDQIGRSAPSPARR